MTWIISKIVGNPMVLIILLVSALVAGATSGSSAAWYIQSIRIDKAEAAHSRYAAEVEKNAAESRLLALDKERFWIKEVGDAQDKAAKREATLKTQLAATRRASDGLRDDLAALRAGIAESSEAACRQTADTVIAVLSECQARYGEMAAAADGHAIDVQTLMDAWPK